MNSSLLNEENEGNYGIVLLSFSFLIMLYAYIGNWLEHKHIHFIHQTGVGIIIGFIGGLILSFWKDLNLDFLSNVFFYGMLPPMIFSGGYNLKKSMFFQNFTYISLYGALGTIVTFGIIFGLTYLVNQAEWFSEWGNLDSKIVLSTALMIKYSATICASDSVAALTMIKPNKYPKLFSIIFGQGMINDAVAIILFHVVGKIFDNLESETDAAYVIVLRIIGNFILNVVTSFLIGGICALVCTYICKNSRFISENPVAQVAILYVFGIMSYAISEIFQMSGVITVLVCGIFLGHFNFYNLSTTGKIATGVTFQTISFLAEALVFIYLGATIMYYVNPNNNETFSYTFILSELAICTIGRFTSIFGLSYFVKIFKKNWEVSFYQLLIVSLAGLIRGSVAFALILIIEQNQHDDPKALSAVRTSVLFIVLITTIFLGAIMPNFITTCLKKDKKSNPLLKEEQEEDVFEELQKENKKEKSRIGRFDEEFLKPMFIYNYVERKEQIKEFKKLLKLNSPEYKGGEYTGIIRASARETIRQSKFIEGKRSLYTDEDIK